MNDVGAFDGTMMVLSKERGYIPIKDVQVRELVYADGGFTAVKSVSKVDDVQEVYEVEPSNSITTICSAKTKIKYLYTHIVKKSGAYSRKLKDAEPCEISNLPRGSTNYYGISLPNEISLPVWKGVLNKRYNSTMNNLDHIIWSESFWWTVGRYIADGHIRHSGGIAMTIGNDKLEESIKHIPAELHYCTEAMKDCNVTRLHFSSKELEAFCRQFGHSATSKTVPPEFLSMSPRLVSALLDGYFSGDGYDSGKYMGCRTVSKKLALSLAMMVPIAYGTPAYIGFSQNPDKKLIKGKLYNQHDMYRAYYSKHPDKNRLCFIRGGNSWAYARHNPQILKGYTGDMYSITTESGEIAVNNISFMDNRE